MIHKALVTLGSLVGLAVIVVVLCNLWVVRSTQARIISDSSQLPSGRVGLLLGTSAYLSSGAPNPWFENRIKAAANLYSSGHIQRFIVSGANPDASYNEPRKMYQALRKAGVPDSALTLDFAGFRTLDSVIRAKEVFGEDDLIIISQQFHGHRALFIADRHDVTAVAYAAGDVSLKIGWRVLVREALARVRAVLDIYLWRTGPKFLGPQEPVDQQTDVIPASNQSNSN